MYNMPTGMLHTEPFPMLWLHLVNLRFKDTSMYINIYYETTLNYALKCGVPSNHFSRQSSLGENVGV